MSFVNDVKKCLFLIPGPAIYEIMNTIEEKLNEEEQKRIANLLGFGLSLSCKCIHKEKSELILQEFCNIEKINEMIEKLEKQN